MREAIGGIWIINVILFFIVIMIGYMGISINYTRAFRVKNRIITVLEETGNTNDTQTVLNVKDANNQTFWERTGYTYNDIVIEPTGSTVGFAKACKFLVSVPLDITIPVVNYDLKIYARGETRTIYNGTGSCGV